jgi:hypothetical protein
MEGFESDPAVGSLVQIALTELISNQETSSWNLNELHLGNWLRPHRKSLLEAGVVLGLTLSFGAKYLIRRREAEQHGKREQPREDSTHGAS